MAKLALRALLGGVLLLLACCAPSLDAEQGRICRMLLPALFPEEAGIAVLASEAVTGTGSGVHVTFRAGQEGQRPHLLTCRFGGTGYSASKRDLVAVLIDGVGLGESTLYILKEKWLESAHAVMADPGPPKSEGGVLTLERWQAVALQHILGGLPRLTILCLLALSTALIYGLIGRINLAFGEFAALGGIATSLIAATAAILTTWSPGLIDSVALGGAVLIAALYGRVTGTLVLWPLSDRGGQPILVAGVGLLVFVQEGLRLAQGARTIWLPPAGAGSFMIASSPGFDVRINASLISVTLTNLAVLVFTLVFMHRSRFGRNWRAMADDPLAASLLGIDPRATLIRTSAIATMLAGLAGASITLSYGGMHFSGGTLLGLTALIAAILGGVGSLAGAVLGALAIGGFQIGWSALQQIAHWELATFTLLSIALVLKPGGFFGYADGAHRKA